MNSKTKTLLEESTEEYLHGLVVSKDFLNTTQKALAIKEREQKGNLDPIKIILLFKKKIKKVKRQAKM